MPGARVPRSRDTAPRARATREVSTMQRIRSKKAPRRQRAVADFGSELEVLAVRSLWQLLGLSGPRQARKGQ